MKSVTAGPAMKNEPDSAEAVALYTAFVALSAGGGALVPCTAHIEAGIAVFYSFICCEWQPVRAN